MRKILFIFSIIYFPIATIIGFGWMQNINIIRVVSFTVWQLFLVKTCFEIARTIFAIFTAEKDISSKKILESFPKVALLYVCRDDVEPSCLAELKYQRYPNYDVFVLDDSKSSFSRNIVNRSKYKIIRRKTLKGYKAGNLNHWLSKYGKHYKYFVIFDNDSKASPDFIEQMVRYAEYPENKDVAIFQSKIYSWNDNHFFSKTSGIMAPVSMTLLGRLGNQTGTVISFGHNNLHRIDAIQKINGFDEELTAEDIVATLRLDQLGYRTVLVNIKSYEADPKNIFQYCRRAVRWAGQTATLFKHSWIGVSGQLKLELSHQLLNYFINGMFFCWIIASLWSSETSLGYFWNLLEDLFVKGAYGWGGKLIFAAMGIFIANHILMFLFSRNHGVKIVDYLNSTIFTFVVNVYILIPVLKSILSSFFGKKVVFTPSNTDISNYSFSKVIKNTSPFTVLGLLSLIRYILVLGVNPWDYIGGWWATIFLATPILLNVYHKDALFLIRSVFSHFEITHLLTGRSNERM